MDQPEGVGKGVWRLPDPGPVRKSAPVRIMARTPQAEKEVTYVDLVKRLKKHGFTKTEASITNKLKCGTFSATFFLACLAAMELEGVVLDEI
jgi:hypothetical protein